MVTNIAQSVFKNTKPLSTPAQFRKLACTATILVGMVFSHQAHAQAYQQTLTYTGPSLPLTSAPSGGCTGSTPGNFTANITYFMSASGTATYSGTAAIDGYNNTSPGNGMSISMSGAMVSSATINLGTSGGGAFSPNATSGGISYTAGGAGGDNLSTNGGNPGFPNCIWSSTTSGTWTVSAAQTNGKQLGVPQDPVPANTCPGCTTTAVPATNSNNMSPSATGNPMSETNGVSAPIDSNNMMATPANQHITGLTEHNLTTYAGDPIDAATGNVYISETDYVGGPSTGLALIRSYNSGDSTASTFGAGWHTEWQRALVVSGSTVTITRADGRRDIFTLSGGVYTTDADVPTTLTAITTPITGYKVVRADDSAEIYNSSGQLVSVTTRNGRTTTLTYTSGHLTTVTGPFGDTLGFTYTTGGNVHTMTDVSGATYTYAYDTHNNLLSVTYPDTTVRQYVYANATFPNLMTSLVDEKGNTYASWTYNSLGQGLTSQHAGGADLTTMTYYGSSVAVTDARSNSYTLNFTTLFGVAKPSAVSGVYTPVFGGNAFTYDANGFLSKFTDYNNNVTTYTHDSHGQQLTRVEAYSTSLARTITTTWNASFHLPATVAEPNRTTTFTYDTNGNLLTRSVSNGTLTSTWTWTYNSYGQVLTAKDPDNNTTTYTYNSNGTLATATDALSHLTRFTSYDSNHRLLSMTDPNGLVIAFTYDGRGRVKTYVKGSLTTTYTYDNAGNLTKVTRPDSSYTSFTYDNAHRLTGIGDALGNAILYTLDAASNVTLVRAENSSATVTQTHSFTYDSVNHILHSIGALSQYTAYSYDNQGNITYATDPLNRTTIYTFDQLNRIATINDPYYDTITPGYDANDHVTTIIDPRTFTTTYTWNGMDQQTAISSPDTGSTALTYDNANNVLTSTDARSDVTTYTYDALNRVHTASYTGGGSATYTYDGGTYGKGHLTGLTDVTGTTSWTYDIYGRVTQKQQVTGTVTRTTGYSYDTYGRFSTITYPSGNVITLTYDADGRVNKIAKGTLNLLSSIAYMPFGQVSGWTEGSGATYARTIDQDGRISVITI
ncbi:MAG: DUF6531 domain-containing protein, partial [Alphaproteobacteria bacterium]